ncbi:MAG: anhydro-N-acetylmuramic acid kinase [Flavobacteriaceae bacterium]
MKVFKVLGLMSGTSLDGLDLAYCHFWEESGSWQFEIQKATTSAYNTEWTEKLQSAITYDVKDLFKLDREYGVYLGQQARAFIDREVLEVDYIASHGHTVHHQPDAGFTYQIGSGQHLATESGYLTICDFRTKDLVLGGQGAPLVPIGDQLFFSQYHFCLNLGGISNLSLEIEGKRIAYDIGIANMLLNHLSCKLGSAFDAGGTIARQGRLDENLLSKLNNLPYYALPYPKSTGFEWFSAKIIPLVERSDLEIPDLLKTSVYHIAEQIARQLQLHPKGDRSNVLVTGGGAFNDYLIEVLNEKLGPDIDIMVPSKKLVSFKEAMVFAFMGLLRIQGQTNVLSSVTGARTDSCSGVLYMP